MLMRNSNTGVFELFDINNNTIAPMTTQFGQVGLEWSISGVSATPASAPPTTQLSGIAADPAGAALGQLMQAMAAFASSAPATAASSPLSQAPGNIRSAQPVGCDQPSAADLVAETSCRRRSVLSSCVAIITIVGAPSRAHWQCAGGLRGTQLNCFSAVRLLLML